MSKSESMSIDSLLTDQSTQFNLSLQNCILAVSGGPDSMALLYSVFKAGGSGTVVHINYEKRGNESDLDQELVEGMSAEWGFDCISLKPDMISQSGNFQNKARDVRYQIFRDMKRELEADCIILAHHQDDQVETILQKIFRGSAVARWQGMKVWDGELFRPFLNLTKSRILDYCESEAIPYRQDASNDESMFARNIIRHELTPLLDDFFPGWKQNILNLEETGSLFENLTDEIFSRISDSSGIIREDWLNLEDRIKPLMLKRLMDLKGIKPSKGILTEIKTIAELQTGQKIQITEHHWLIRNRNYLLIDEKKTKKDQSTITVNRVQAESGFKSGFLSIAVSELRDLSADLYCDADLLSWPITFERWKNGDKFIPLGMSNHQKVSDHLTNRKIAAHKKEKALILRGADGTIEALIFPELSDNGEKGTISEAVKVTEKTRNYAQFFIDTEL